MAQALAVLGTGSGVGKSLIVSALCRILKRKGYNVAPFKAQNMALNSFVTNEGAEIGRAQALQAEAAGIEPSVDMNPVLLKASGKRGTQVILSGRPFGTMSPAEYYDFRERAWEEVVKAWERLSSRYETIIIEGAGSPAEINLMDREIVNMAVVRHTGAKTILVGDIDHGGVYASLYGTVLLLGKDSEYIRGFVINKFRGDRAILEPGNRMIEEKTGIPVVGIIPYQNNLWLDEEDSLGLPSQNGKVFSDLKIVILSLPHISNFTDFLPLALEPDVDILYSSRKEDIVTADAVIIPGSKTTIEDLNYLYTIGIVESLKEAQRKGVEIVGICGGYQMLGRIVKDPDGAESQRKEIRGMGFLDTETIFKTEKTTAQVIGKVLNGFRCSDTEIRGYEIHMGETTGEKNLFKIKRIPSGEELIDGTKKGPVWGTYIHGIFDNDILRREFLNTLREKKGLRPLEPLFSYNVHRQKALDRLAKTIEKHIDMTFIERLLSLR